MVDKVQDGRALDMSVRMVFVSSRALDMSEARPMDQKRDFLLFCNNNNKKKGIVAACILFYILGFCFFFQKIYLIKFYFK
jgi:hypothetical protein